MTTLLVTGIGKEEYTVRASPGGTTCRTSGTTCQVSGLQAGTRYLFTVQARNAKGVGLVAQSAPVSTPAAPAAMPDPSKPEQTLT